MDVISKPITYDFTYYGSRPCCACACTLLAWRTSPRKPPKHPYAQYRPSAPRTSLDLLRAVGAVQVGAAVGAEVVAGLYVDHRVSAHGALFFLACSHPPCSRIRSILLALAGTAPAAVAIPLMRALAPGLPSAYLDRRCTRLPQFRAAELKICTKCKPISIFNLLSVFDVWDGRWGYYP